MSLPVHDIEQEMLEIWRNYRSGEDAHIEEAYERVMPFCMRVCSKICGKYIDTSDEEASITRMALLETMNTYNPDRGTLMVFLGQVIRSRIIDYKRKENNHKTIPFSFFTNHESLYPMDVDDGFFEQMIDDIARKQEIEQLQGLLFEFGISFQELSHSSPRQTKTREQAKQVACMIAEDEKICTHLFQRKQIPIQMMEKKWQVNRKLVDRYRKFIIAGVLINKYDLSYLMPYVLPVQRGERQC